MSESIQSIHISDKDEWAAGFVALRPLFNEAKSLEI